MIRKIPLHEPKLKGNELRYLRECVKSSWLSSSGKFVRLFEKKIAKYTNSRFAIACLNGTAALQLSLHLAGVRVGDEVIAPTITFIAPINAIKYNGANPIFMDPRNELIGARLISSLEKLHLSIKKLNLKIFFYLMAMQFLILI